MFGVFSTPEEDADKKSSGEDGKAAVSGWWSMATSALDKVSKHAASVVEQGAAVIKSAQDDIVEFTSSLQDESEELKGEVSERIGQVTKQLARAVEDSDKNLSEKLEKVGSMLTQMIPVSESSASPDGSSQGGVATSRAEPVTKKHSSVSESKLAAMQADEKSFTRDPGTGAEFKEYLDRFGSAHEEERREEVLDVLNRSDAVRGFHEALVPNTVDERLFWARYFFQVDKLKEEEQRRRFMLARLGAARPSPPDPEVGQENMPSSVATPPAAAQPQRDATQAPVGEQPTAMQADRGGESINTENRVPLVTNDTATDPTCPVSVEKKPPDEDKSAASVSSGGSWVDVGERKHTNTCPVGNGAADTAEAQPFSKLNDAKVDSKEPGNGGTGQVVVGGEGPKVDEKQAEAEDVSAVAIGDAICDAIGDATADETSNDKAGDNKGGDTKTPADASLGVFDEGDKGDEDCWVWE